MENKRIKSAILVLVLIFSIFTVPAAAESPDVSDTKQNAKTIYCPYGQSAIFEGDISPGSDVDWYTCNANSGDDVYQFLLSDAYQNYVAMYAEDQNGVFVERLSKKEGNDGGDPVETPPVYFKVINDYGNTYYGYQFFIVRE